MTPNDQIAAKVSQSGPEHEPHCVGVADYSNGRVEGVRKRTAANQQTRQQNPFAGMK